MQSFDPQWASPPGASLEKALKHHGVSEKDAARILNLSLSAVEELFAGERKIDPDLSAALEGLTGASSEFWIRRQEQYDRGLEVEEANARRILSAHWYSRIPVSDMKRLGWISNCKRRIDTAKEVARFFSVDRPESWFADYEETLQLSAFKSSNSFDSDPYHMTAWLRQGELIGRSIPCSHWDPEAFRRALDAVRKLTNEKDPAVFIPKLTKICARSGVAVAIVRPISKCRARGATRFLSNEKALIQLSGRHLSDDQLWFTFFHEAAHLLLHGKAQLFVEGIGQVDERKYEEEADQFAEDVLLNYRDIRCQLPSKITWKRIVRCALNLGISPGLIVGQLQHKGIIDYKSYSFLKRRYRWDGDRLVLAPKKAKVTR